jgi:cell division septum initiation protein DivIVA
MTVKIEPLGEDGATLNPANELQYNTDLTSAKWSCVPVSEINNRVNPGGGIAIYYPLSQCQNGKISFNRDKINEPVKLTIEGTAPAVQHTTNFSVLEIGEYDSHNSLKKTVRYSAIVVNVSEIQDRLKKMDVRLASFRSDIDEKAAIGVNTTQAEEKYQVAWSDISTPCCKSARDVDVSEKHLTLRETSITEGETLLDKVWAEKTVADAEEIIGKANNTIDSIHANLSKSFDERLTQSYVKRDNALADIAISRDRISQGDFPVARGYAYNAYDEANASYYEALDAERRMADPLKLSQVPVALLITAVLGGGIAVMVSRWRTRK